MPGVGKITPSRVAELCCPFTSWSFAVFVAAVFAVYYVPNFRTFQILMAASIFLLCLRAARALAIVARCGCGSDADTRNGQVTSQSVAVCVLVVARRGSTDEAAKLICARFYRALWGRPSSPLGSAKLPHNILNFQILSLGKPLGVECHLWREASFDLALQTTLAVAL